MRTTCLVQYLRWVFATQERKERKEQVNLWNPSECRDRVCLDDPRDCLRDCPGRGGLFLVSFFPLVVTTQLKVGFDISRTNADSDSLESTSRCISPKKIVETNQLIDRNLNMILTRQRCGQRSSMVAGSKRRVLAFRCQYESAMYVWERI